jgi:hypothetical protein
MSRKRGWTDVLPVTSDSSMCRATHETKKSLSLVRVRYMDALHLLVWLVPVAIVLFAASLLCSIRLRVCCGCSSDDKPRVICGLGSLPQSPLDSETALRKLLAPESSVVTNADHGQGFSAWVREYGSWSDENSSCTQVSRCFDTQGISLLHI